MIKNREPLSMAEATEYIKGDSETGAEVLKFIKKFVKIDAKKASELRKEIESLELIKIRPEDTTKIIDLLPNNSENLNKIFNDMSLDEDETNKILETIKKFK
ncbi:MAG: hypothetical protein KJ879_02405 [Nanoarchaeota archaeon]|nr:hypothetical protein [Nanoarchaeota archaeon]